MLSRIEYPVSISYVPDWGAQAMLREVIANAVDSAAPFTVHFDRDKQEAVISDEGSGFEPRCLMFGEGSEKTGQQIGQFREGLKLAMLIAARQKLKFQLQTTGFSVERVAIEPTTFGADGLVVYTAPPVRSVGTVIRVSATQAEFDSAVVLFAGMRATGTQVRSWTTLAGVQKARAPGHGDIYINGLYVQSGRSLFTYNITGEDAKKFQNRDRTVINGWSLNTTVTSLLSTLNDPDMLDYLIGSLRRTWRAGAAPLETQLYLWPSYKVRADWEKAVHRVYGVLPSRIVFADEYSDLVVPLLDSGYILIDPKVPGLRSFLCNIGAASVKDMLVKQCKRDGDTDHSEITVLGLTDAEKAAVTRVRRAIKQLFPDTPTPKVRVFSLQFDNPRVRSKWQDNALWIKQSLLNDTSPGGMLRLMGAAVSGMAQRAGKRQTDAADRAIELLVGELSCRKLGCYTSVNDIAASAMSGKPVETAFLYSALSKPIRGAKTTWKLLDQTGGKLWPVKASNSSGLTLMGMANGKPVVFTFKQAVVKGQQLYKVSAWPFRPTHVTYTPCELELPDG